MRKLTAGVVAALAAFGLAGCGSSGKSYKTITCGAYAKLANSPDAVNNGALDIASAYLDASPVDPRHGAQDAADFGDQILSACQSASAGTKIADLQDQIVAGFLAQHPEDAA